MKKLTLFLTIAVVGIASACSKEKKITKSLWKEEGTWKVTTSSYAYYSMGTYNTSTGKYEDSLTASSGDFNGNTFVFEKYDNASGEGNGTYTSTDTTINFTYAVLEKSNFGGSKGEFELTMQNDGSTEQEQYDIVSHEDTKMSLKKVESTGWSITPYEIIHSYITIDIEKQ